MPRVIQSPEDFHIIAENIHATRIVLLKGKRVTTLDDGTLAVTYKVESGETEYLKVPPAYKSTQYYEQGNVKHFMIAMQKGIGSDPEEREEGAAYVRWAVRRQVLAGARFLDVNVDEVSYELDVQKKAMTWVINTVQGVSPIPPSVDSSSPEIIEAGLAEYDGRVGPPMINSLALERLETLDLVKQYNTKVIVSAAGEEGMPQDAGERVENVRKLMEAVDAAGVPRSDAYIDCLVFPISVSHEHGKFFLDAVTEVRELFGNEVHITGGLSNVSFGLPKRKLVNDSFIQLGLEAGIDSGIVDPVASKIGEVFTLDTESLGVKLAQDMLNGNDDFCANYIQAWRDKNI